VSDLSALAERLTALSASDDTFDAGARVISTNGSPQPMQAFLAVIDETVLERKLAFSAGDTIVNVIAAGRRLRGITAVEPALAAAEPVLGQSLSRQEPENLTIALDVLSSVLSQTDQLTVRSHPPEPFGTGGERGVTASDLATEWQSTAATTPATKAASPLDAFLDAAEVPFSAMLHVSAGQIVAEKGNIAQLQSIWETQVDAFIKAQNKSTTQVNGPRLVALDGALDGGQAAALILSDDDLALLIYPADQIAALHAAWRNAL